VLLKIKDEGLPRTAWRK